MSKLRIALIDDDLNIVDIKSLHADVILLNMDHPHRDIIESCVSQYELPTVLFTHNSNKDTIRNAIDAGVTAYIVDGIDPTKLENILEISIEQFQKHKNCYMA